MPRVWQQGWQLLDRAVTHRPGRAVALTSSMAAVGHSRSPHLFSPSMWVCNHSLVLALQRRNCSSAADPPSGRSSGLANVGRSSEKGKGEEPSADEDEDLKLNIYQPPQSPDEKRRQVQTQRFLRLLLTTPEEQNWKDMITAALRHGTWKPHHMEAVLHGIQLNLYNEAPSAEATLRHRGVSQRDGSASTTPTQRLRRARDILIFCKEEGALHESEHDTGKMANSGSSATGHVRNTSSTPSSAMVHHLLVCLLNAALRSSTGEAAVTAAKTEDSLSQYPSAPPLSTFSEVWTFLAWMELHGYHLLSNAVIDTLETVVDTDEESNGLQRATSPTSPSVLQTEQVKWSTSQTCAAASQQMNRLDYLRKERALLREAGHTASAMAQNDSGASTMRQARRAVDSPRADPK